MRWKNLVHCTLPPVVHCKLVVTRWVGIWCWPNRQRRQSVSWFTYFLSKNTDASLRQSIEAICWCSVNEVCIGDAWYGHVTLNTFDQLMSLWGLWVSDPLMEKLFRLVLVIKVLVAFSSLGSKFWFSYTEISDAHQWSSQVVHPRVRDFDIAVAANFETIPQRFHWNFGRVLVHGYLWEAALDSWSIRNRGTWYLRHVRNEQASLPRVTKNRESFWKWKQNSRGGSNSRELRGLVFTKMSLFCTSKTFSVFQKLCSSNGRRFSAADSPFPYSRCPRRCAMLPYLDPSLRLTVHISHSEMHSQGLIKNEGQQICCNDIVLVLCEFMKDSRVDALISTA